MGKDNKPSLTDLYQYPESKKLEIIWMGLTEMWNRLNVIEGQVNEHEQILITGKAPDLPLLERMRNEEMFTKNLRYWGRFLGGAIVIQTLAFIGGIVVAYFRFLPVLERIAAQQP